MSENYTFNILGQPIVEPDFEKWKAFMGVAREIGLNRVASDIVGNAWISTVFDGLSPFETAIFSGMHAGYEKHYQTLTEAVDGHAAVVMMLREVG